MRDPYEVLGVARSASEAEIRDAFRRLARRHHPDRNPGDPDAQQRFADLNNAFQILSDPERRARFDRLGDVSRNGTAAKGPGFQNLDDLFNDLFGGFAGPGSTSGDLQRVVELSFLEAALGCTKSLRYERLDHCGECDGGGAKAGTVLRTCSSCGGVGRVRLGAIGMFVGASMRPCPTCLGRGRIPEEACSRCGGRGLSKRSREIEITIPRGIENGASQIVAGAGDRTVPRQPAGDLELVIRVRPDARFEREGDDVFSSVTIPFITAALGGSVEIETVHGKVEAQVPAGTQHDVRLRLRGQGIPHRFRSGKGDHYLRVQVLVPKIATDRGKALVSDFEHETRREGGFFERVKEWFG